MNVDQIVEDPGAALDEIERLERELAECKASHEAWETEHLKDMTILAAQVLQMRAALLWAGQKQNGGWRS